VGSVQRDAVLSVMCMSCVDQLIAKGYRLAFSRGRAVVLDKTHWEDVQYYCGPSGCLVLLYPVRQGFKRIKIKYTVSITAYGTNPVGTYNCAAGFAIQRLIIWIYDPMSKIMELVNTMMMLTVLMQILSAAIG